MYELGQRHMGTGKDGVRLYFDISDDPRERVLFNLQFE